MRSIGVGAPDAGGYRQFSIHARPDGDDRTLPWTRHATGALAPAAVGTSAAGGELAQWPPAGAVEEPVDGVYGRLADLGYEYGPAFQGLRSVWRRGEDVFAEVHLPDALHESAAQFGIHPALFDAVLHPLVLDAAAGGGPGRIDLPRVAEMGGGAHVGPADTAPGVEALGQDRAQPSGERTFTGRRGGQGAQ